MGVEKGHDLRIQIDLAGGTTYAGILYATNCSFELSRETIETAHKDTTGSYADFTPGKITGTLTHSGLMSDASTDYGPLFTAFKNGTVFTWTFKSGKSGGGVFTGSGFFSGFSIDSPDQENASLELPIQLTGEPVFSTAA